MAQLLCISLCLFALIATCFADLLDSRSRPGTSHALIDHLASPPEYNLPSHSDADLDLLDIILVASVDGKFHALNRTSGHTLWSMSSSPSTNISTPATLSPLIRTAHVDNDPDLTDETTPQELYVIEPQSGDIYVMATPSSPLQRFPLSMAELVDVSPFSLPDSEDGRMFVGRKETSLLLIELETGKIKATLSSECAWDENGDVGDRKIDLDELEGSNSAMSTSTEVYIGRTDYYISIYTPHIKQNPSVAKQPMQNLSFSVYGPNNKDNRLQATYRRTKDDSYVHSLPNGAILFFKGSTEADSVPNPVPQLLWGQSFNNPVVAIFDVLRKSKSHPRKTPFVLLHPRSQLEDIFPNTAGSHLSSRGFGYVGMVKETGSLFAMSQSSFPLVAFSSGDLSPHDRLIDASDDLPLEVDEITIRRKKLEAGPGGDCTGDRMYTDRRCLIGRRELMDADGTNTRMRLLLDGPENEKFPLVQPGRSVTQRTDEAVAVNNETIGVPTIPVAFPIPVIDADGGWSSATRVNFLGVAIFTVFIGAVGGVSFWLGVRRVRETRSRSPAMVMESEKLEVDQAVHSPPVTPSAPTSVVPLSEHPTLDLVPSQAPSMTESLSDPSPQANHNNGNDNGPMVDVIVEDSDRDGEADIDVNNPAIPGKRKTRRGKRGKKKKVVTTIPGAEEGEEEEELVISAEENLTIKESEPTISPTLVISSPKVPPVAPSLVVSDTVLGFGSHGTVVFQGSLQGRAVAVKRLLQDFVTLAAREVSILQESDDHPNVIRYYYQEAHANFLYIALELCPASLADIIESPDRDAWRDIAIAFEPKRALWQITSGLKHLHALKLVHRDIKPQNILVSAKPGLSGKGSYRMLISDFGLCKKLDVDQTSFLPTAHGAMAAGTVGWRAPEILRGEVKLDDVSDEHSMSSRGSTGTINGGQVPATPGTGKSMRLTKSVDIFALGCLFYYALTNGGHPFGDRFERDVNIFKNAKSLEGLERFGEEGMEAVDLIESMLDPQASERPDTTSCLLHPFFWDSGRRLSFLQDASDRFEVMCRDPRDPYLTMLEREASGIVGNDWHSRLDKVFIENLGKFRKYDGRSVQDLLRALRNKKHHYQDMPDHVKRHLGPMPEGFLGYFTRRFPRLFLHVHSMIANSGLRTESMFRSYFELGD